MDHIFFMKFDLVDEFHKSYSFKIYQPNKMKGLFLAKIPTLFIYKKKNEYKNAPKINMKVVLGDALTL